MYEFQCEVLDCQKIDARLVLPQEEYEQVCSCNGHMNKITSGPRGYVKGSTTPCKQ